MSPESGHRRSRWMLALYPRRWRERYGQELLGLVEDERLSLALVLDVLRGAVDARLNEAEIFADPPGRILRRVTGTLIEALALGALAVAAMTKASEDTAMSASGTAAFDAAQIGLAVALAGLLVLAAPTALRVRSPRIVVGLALPLVAFLGLTVVLAGVASTLGPATGTIAFWAWALAGAAAVCASAREGAAGVRENAPAPGLAVFWPAAWLAAGGALVALGGVTAWSAWAATQGASAGLGGLPAPLVAIACALASMLAAGVAWHCARAGQQARRAVPVGR